MTRLSCPLRFDVVRAIAIITTYRPYAAQVHGSTVMTINAPLTGTQGKELA